MGSRGSRIVEFRFGNFIASLLWLILIVLVIVSLATLPLIFIILFMSRSPVNGQVLTPYLFLSMMVDPTRTLPVLKFIMHTTLFKVAVFPGFGYGRYICSSYHICRTKVSG